MKTFCQFITENKTPKTHWLAFDIPKNDDYHNKHSEVVQQLKDGEMKGVKGISNDKRIVRNWFHTGRNSLLVMPSHKVHELNPHLREIEYDNPHEFMRNNISDVHRIFNKDPKSSFGTSQVIGHLFDYGTKGANRYNSHSVGWMGHEPFNVGQDIHSIWKDHHGGRMPEIHSPKDFEHHVHDALNRDEARKKEYNEGKTDKAPILKGYKSHENIRNGISMAGGVQSLLQHAGKEIKRVYGDEGEVAVDAPTFKVPKGSKLIHIAPLTWEKHIRDNHAARPNWTTESDKKYMSDMDRVHSSLKELGNHYDTKIIDDHHYGQHRVLQKRPKFKPKKEQA